MLKSINIGKRIIELTTCASTNVTALEKIKEGELVQGDVVFTKEQTAGKGQKGSAWETETDKNLIASFVLEPVFLRPSYQFELTVVASLALISLLEKKGVAAKIKWPNDIYLNEKKLAGMLIENKIKGSKLSFSVVGVGLNVNQTSFNEPKAISLKQFMKTDFSVMGLLLELSNELGFFYAELKKGIDLRPLYFQKLIGIEKEILFDDGEQFWSKVVGVDDYGALQLLKNGVEKKYGVKEVKFLEL